MKSWLCIDCGGTYTKYAVIHEDLSLHHKGKIPTECTDLELFLSGIHDLWAQHSQVSGIAMSLPGILEIDTGYARTGGSITCINETPIAQLISRRCGGIPVTIENDAKAAAMAEVADGVLKGCKNGIVIVIGTALGGTVVVDGKILRGSNLFAGEVSYLYYSNEMMQDKDPLTFPEESPENRQLYYMRSVPKHMCALYAARTGKKLADTDAPWVMEQLRNGDENALFAVRSCCRDLGMMLFNLQCVIDPDVIAIGGGISNDPLYIDLLQQETAAFARHIYPGAPTPVIKACRHKNDANLVGTYFAHRLQY